MEYVFYDVDKIKEFVFDSFKPKGVKGASELLKCLDFDLDNKKKESLLQELTDKFNIPDEHIIFSKGGSGLIKTPDNNGEEICRWLEDKFKNHTKSGSLSAVFHKEEKDFDTSFAILNFKAREKKSHKFLSHDLGITTFNADETDRCDYCGKRNSCHTIELGNERIPICEICLWKRNQTGKNNKAASKAETLEDIGKALNVQDTKYILVIYGDLNEAGAHLAAIKSEEALKRFSNGISKTLDHTRSEIENVLEQKGFQFLAPVIGGDDIILFTHPASFELIKEHLYNIEKELQMQDLNLKMNFAFLMAKYNFPIYHLFKLSQSLLDKTKDLYYEDKQTRYGFFKVMEGNSKPLIEDVYIGNDFKFLFDTAKHIHENKKIHTSALYNIWELVSNKQSPQERDLNVKYFLSRHPEFKDYIPTDNQDFLYRPREGKTKLNPDVLEDLIDMKDLLYRPGEPEEEVRRKHDQ
ncbi:MAG TPA: hypothetical protein VK469_14770 [Candidatus Kapabacteria bacterium]|nr:hypothetical protein [Candidatus Kapabacteria bacterium]